jgi:iodotyrosine deiodinase
MLLLNKEFVVGVMAGSAVVGLLWSLRSIMMKTTSANRSIKGGGGGGDYFGRFSFRQLGESKDKGHAYFTMDRIPTGEAIERSHAFYEFLNQRRTVRFFSSDPIDMKVIENCIRTAGTSPSGAHLQPWRFIVVQDMDLRKEIREVVEAEETENYNRRMSRGWVEDLDPIMSALHSPSQDTISKPYLTEAPCLIVVMKIPITPKDDGTKQVNYYAEQSVGIASGILLTALHNANLVTLTSTPLNAESKIRAILGRPDYEKVFLLLPVGYSHENATVPMRDETTLRKPIDDILVKM